MRFAAKPLLAGILAICASSRSAGAGPIDIVLTPSPQEFSNTCQSYSMALAVSFAPNSPFVADTATELRDLEQQIRAALLASAKQGGRTQPIRDDWRAAVEKVTNGVLTVQWKSFDHLDPAIHFVADLTGISNPDALGTVLSVALVKTPAMMSFKRIESSTYATSHIVTVFGVQLPDQSMGDDATPELLAVNSAVQYPGGVKNICAQEDLSDADRYRALTTLTSNYELNLFSGDQPYLITWITNK
jgi:hypothetical protein